MALLISECFIKPKNRVKESIEPHYLGPDDVKILSMEYMQKGLLFINPSNLMNESQIDSFLVKLKDALSLALVHFYPLAGRLETKTYEDEHRSWIYVDCNKGSGARFIHAKVNRIVDDITSSDNVGVTRSFFELGETGIVNHDGHSRALVSVQVTELVDGIFIGFTMNHALADATSLWHFINTLSEICCFNNNNNMSFDEENNVVVSRVPIYRPSCWGELDPVIKLPYLERDEFIVQLSVSEPPVVEKTFRFSAESVAKLKAIANGETGTETGAISSFQSVCALVWKSITKARKLRLDEETAFLFVVNTRLRLKPPLSTCQFGNFCSLAKGACRVDELLGSGLGSVALLLNRAVAVLDDNTIRTTWKDYFKAPFVAKPGWSESVFGSRPIVVGGSTKFDMYGQKFGLGKPVTIRSGYGNRSEGKLSAHPGSDGPGSVDLSMSLVEETFINLESDQEFMSYVS